jgi:hypothetical protein
VSNTIVQAMAAQNTKRANIARGSRSISDSNSESNVKQPLVWLNLGIATRAPHCGNQMHDAAKRHYTR